MAISEFQISLDLHHGNPECILEILEKECYKTSYGYLFVDSVDGQCYLFDKNGKSDDIRKVRHIEVGAFYGCSNLTSINIPNTVESIGYKAFANCKSLVSIIIPDSVKSIGEKVFDSCISLTSIVITNGVESIEYEAFYNCKSLTSISIPDSVKSIGDNAFYECNSLKRLIFKGKTIDEVKAMENYPFGIIDKSAMLVEQLVYSSIDASNSAHCQRSLFLMIS